MSELNDGFLTTPEARAQADQDRIDGLLSDLDYDMENYLRAAEIALASYTTLRTSLEEQGDKMEAQHNGLRHLVERMKLLVGGIDDGA